MAQITRSPAMDVEAPRGPFAPYAPVRSVTLVLRYDRERRLREPVTARSLAAAGVSPSMGPRTLQALRFLRLVDEAGYRTDSLDALRAASDQEFAGRLAEVLRLAYAEIFSRLGPRPPEATKIERAFRLYEPRSQRGRMTALFLGLASEAGMLTAESPERQARRSARSMPRRRPPSDAMLTVLLERLPASRRWSQDERDRWLRAWAAALDLAIKIQTADPPPSLN
jgi:Family of unknown function (DUF5343)